MGAKTAKCPALAITASSSMRFDPALSLNGQAIPHCQFWDNFLVTRKQKLLLYKAGVCPIMNWELVAVDFPISWVSSTLEATVKEVVRLGKTS